MQINVILEFDDKELGEEWLNKDNLEILLYTNEHTKKELLKVIRYENNNPSLVEMLDRIALYEGENI